MAQEFGELGRRHRPMNRLRGVVMDSAAGPAPESVEDLVTVRVHLPGRKAEPYGPMPWTARGTLLPQAGDTAYIERVDNTGEWICVLWWPGSYSSQP